MESDDLTLKREQAARVFGKLSRFAALFAAVLAAIAAVDLVTGSITGDRHLDYVLLALGAMSVWTAFTVRRSADTIRAAGRPPQPKPRMLAGLIASMTVSLAFVGGVGYVIGGWAGAAVLTLVAVVVVAASVARGLRRRRNASAP